MRPANSRLSAPIEAARANRIATEVKTGLRRPKNWPHLDAGVPSPQLTKQVSARRMELSQPKDNAFKTAFAPARARPFAFSGYVVRPVDLLILHPIRCA